jgi:large subunit ribosomal protein L10
VTFCDGEFTDPARELTNFAAAHKVLDVRCGVFEGNFLDKEGVQRIAKLPPREILLAQLMGTLQAPMAGLVRTLNGLLVKLVMTLSAIREQKGGS